MSDKFSVTIASGNYRASAPVAPKSPPPVPLKLEEQFVPATSSETPFLYQKRVVAVVDKDAQAGRTQAQTLPQGVSVGTVVSREVAIKGSNRVFTQDLLGDHCPVRILLSDETGDGRVMLADKEKEQRISTTSPGAYMLKDLAGLAHLVDPTSKTPRFQIPTYRNDTYYVSAKGGASGYQWQKQPPASSPPPPRPGFTAGRTAWQPAQRPQPFQPRQVAVTAWEREDGIEVPTFHQPSQIKALYSREVSMRPLHLEVFVTGRELRAAGQTKPN